MQYNPYYVIVFVMLIRNVLKSDMDSIMEVEESSFIPDCQENRQVFASRLETFPQGFLVLEDNGKVQGYFCSELWRELPHDNKIFRLDHDPGTVHDPSGSVLYISSFALLPAMRGMKLGEAFFHGCLKRVTECCAGLRSVILLVSQEWDAARHIYENEGFRTIRQIPGFMPSDNIPGGADGIIMVKEIL